MFVDFKSAIKKKNSNEKQLPNALVDYLSSNLPDGLKYQQFQAGVLRITPEGNGEMTVRGLIPKLTEHQKEVLGDSCTHEDVLKYVTNSQTSIKLVPADGETIIVNGEKLMHKDFLVQPATKENSRFVQYIYPSAFPAPRTITLSAEDVSIDVIIHRIPNDSIDIIVYTSDDSSIVNFTTKFFENEQKATFTISINSDSIKTVTDVIKAMTIYNAFMNRTLKLGGVQMSDETTSDKQFSDSTINFWKKVLAIEEVLNLKFNPDRKDIPYKIMADVERLYQSLINTTPIIASYNVDSLNGKWEKSQYNDAVKTKDVLLSFAGTESFNLFEQEFEVPYVSCVFHVAVDRIENENGKQKLILKDADENNKRYTSVLYFKSEEDLEAYNVFENTDKFFTAKKVSEYID